MAAASIAEEVKIPEGIQAKLDGKLIEVSGPKGKLVRRFDIQGIGLKQGSGAIIVEASLPRRKQRSAVGAIKSHLQNMFDGVKDGFKYKLKIVYAHFPITAKVEGKKLLIQNFLGEKSPRVAKIVGDVNVKVEGDEVTVEGINKEEVGQTAINIEQATVVRYRDRRTFQDGIYLISKE
jgi:large subunit ribosomal protein L6